MTQIGGKIIGNNLLKPSEPGFGDPLKPCPKCGGTDWSNHKNDRDSFATAKCDIEGCNFTVTGEDMPDAADKWNEISDLVRGEDFVKVIASSPHRVSNEDLIRLSQSSGEDAMQTLADLRQEFDAAPEPLDLTKITAPFGLLDEATQEALRAWEHGLEFWTNGGPWKPCCDPIFFAGTVYRAKPAPEVPEEVTLYAKRQFNNQWLFSSSRLGSSTHKITGTIKEIKE